MSRASGPQGSRLPRRRARKAWRALRALVAVGLAAAVLAAAAIAAAFLHYARELPSLRALADYRPPQSTKVYDRHGQLAGEFYRERRTVVPREQIPELVKKAVVAAEDASFYQHRGLDFAGIARALLKDLRSMRMAQGASTITQQVVKNLVLSPERSVERKIKEAILARRLEQNLSKDEILALYLNHINFGHSRYGIEEASQFFFGKSVGQLTLGEAALLAGLPQSPGRLSPLRHPERARARQAYVLRQMVRNGFISESEAEAAIAKPLKLAPRPAEPAGPYYLEEVRRRLIARYGEERVYEGGLRVTTGMDRALQEKADASLRAGLEQLDRRFGYKPPELAIPGALLEPVRAAVLGTGPVSPRRAWDFSKVTASQLGSLEELAEAVEERALVPGAVLVAPVVRVGEEQAIVDLGGSEGAIGPEQWRWARPYSPGRWTPAPKRASDVFSPGQLVRARVLELPAARAQAGKARASPSRAQLALAPVPSVQGALLAIDPSTREVVALSGGYDFALSPFNRAVQARRQPGSAFKPFVYAAALESGRFTSASILNDAPEVFRDPWTGKAWKPQNFEREEYDGPLALREALARSKNTISVRLIEAVGPQAVIDLAHRAGIASPLPENLTLALGTGEVSPLELANGYATLAALGLYAEPILISRVTDLDGRVLEESRAEAEETVLPAAAAIVTSLMRSVVEAGTGAAAQALNRPVAAKTGTSSEHRDAWFAGFTPNLVAVAWTGFDDNTPLGPAETGGRAALPIWLELMKAAHEGLPASEFELPEGIEAVRIDPATGLRAPDELSGRVELFIEGTAPLDLAPRPGEADPAMLFLEDQGR